MTTQSSTPPPSDPERRQTRALAFRVQALALLQQAQALDGLAPFLVCHTHEYGVCGYLVWALESPDESAAAKVLDSEYEPDRGETLDIDSGVTLEELTGVSVAHRMPDVLASVPG